MAFGLSINIGMDLGTTNIIIYIPGRGVVLKEPAMVAYNRNSGEVQAYGEEARQMVERTPGNIVALYPMRRGVIANDVVAEGMVEYFMFKAIGKKTLRRPKVYIGTPVQSSGVEKRALTDVVIGAGASDAVIVEGVFLAALGAGIKLNREKGVMVVDIGGGTTEAAVVSSNGVIVGKCLNVAGSDLTEAIMEYIKNKYSLLVGFDTAEGVKRRIGTCQNQLKDMVMNVTGRNFSTGLPETIEFSSSEAKEAMEEKVKEIIQTIRHILEITPPEMKRSLMEQGIMLTGGGALLRGLEVRIERELRVAARTAENAMFCGAIGAGRYPDYQKNKGLGQIQRLKK